MTLNGTDFPLDMAMTEFEKNKPVYDDSWRGTYLIIPIKVTPGKRFEPNGLRYIPFDSHVDELSDKSDLLIRRCNSDYINKYVQSFNVSPFIFPLENGLTLSDLQIYLFENGIGFLTLFTFCHNSQIHLIYQLVNNGYIGDQEGSDTYNRLYDAICDAIKPSNLEIFIKNKSILLNESYIFNLALVRERFQNLETIEQLALNVHKQIDLSSSFYDNSEKDIRYTYGARDVNKKTYRWGCCISTLDISYVYQSGILSEPGIEQKPKRIHDEMLQTSASDLLLTILVLIQKFTCMQLNENIHSEIYEKRSMASRISRKIMQNLKHQVLEFRAFGTLAPSQVSRWNNVCETYRGLLEVLGVNEALSEIEEKIDLLNSEQERRSADFQNRLSLLIAVFGLISIVAAVLTIVDLVATGSAAIVLSLIISSVAILVACLFWIVRSFRK